MTAKRKSPVGELEDTLKKKKKSAKEIDNERKT